MNCAVMLRPVHCNHLLDLAILPVLLHMISCSVKIWTQRLQKLQKLLLLQAKIRVTSGATYVTCCCYSSSAVHVDSARA